VRQPAGAGAQFVLLEGQQAGFDFGRKIQLRTGVAFDHAGALLQFDQRHALAVQAAVDTHMDEPADDAAGDDDDHAVERHAGIERADVKARVHEDQPRPADAEKQVDPEPPLHFAQAPHEAHVFAQRVAEQRQHHRAAGHGDPVAQVVVGLEQLQLGELPGRRDEQGKQRIEQDVAPARVLTTLRLRLLRRGRRVRRHGSARRRAPPRLDRRGGRTRWGNVDRVGGQHVGVGGCGAGLAWKMQNNGEAVAVGRSVNRGFNSCSQSRLAACWWIAFDARA
jgi:hypothetical protein